MTTARGLDYALAVTMLAASTLYHINTQASLSPYPLMRPGDQVVTGEEVNPFFRFYDRHQRSYRVTDADRTVNMVPAIQFLRRVKEGTIRPHNLPGDAFEIAQHFMMLARELLWESVRLAEFRDRPSRQRCIWLIRSLDDVRQWLNLMKVRPAQVVEVRATGRAHVADQSHLAGDSELLSGWYEKARAYWRGDQTAAPVTEVVFEGQVEVVQILELVT